MTNWMYLKKLPVFDRVKNIVVKEKKKMAEYWYFLSFLSFPKCFQQLCFFRVNKTGNCVAKVHFLTLHLGIVGVYSVSKNSKIPCFYSFRVEILAQGQKLVMTTTFHTG